MRWRINRTWKITLVIIAILVVIRLSLPYFITRYVNKVLSEIPGYHGAVDGVGIELIRGAYKIHGLKIFKVNGTKEIPFIDIRDIDLSVEWESLLEGSIVGEIEFDKPILNFIGSKKDEKDVSDEKSASPNQPKSTEKSSDQNGEDVDWTEPIKKLMPLQINRLRINNGKVTFNDFTTKPKVDLHLHSVYLDAQNLNNAKENPEELPSRVYLQASSIGNGQLSLTMRINVLKQMPDLDLDFKFENVNMQSLNDFFGAYAKVDVEKGNFNLYSEIAVLDGKITGYVKPLFTDLKVVDWKKDKDNPARLVWESVIGALAEVFENQRKNQFATQVSLQGELINVKAPFWPALWNIFRNAFIEAFESNTNGSISIASNSKKVPGVGDNTEASAKDKKVLRKERRKEKREQRKERKKAKEQNEKADKKRNKDNS